MAWLALQKEAESWKHLLCLPLQTTSPEYYATYCTGRFLLYGCQWCKLFTIFFRFGANRRLTKWYDKGSRGVENTLVINHIAYCIGKVLLLNRANSQYNTKGIVWNADRLARDVTYSLHLIYTCAAMHSRWDVITPNSHMVYSQWGSPPLVVALARL